MSADTLQHALVTLAALAASAVIARRLLGFVGARPRRTGCACPSGKNMCGTPAADATKVTAHPATLVKGSRLSA